MFPVLSRLLPRITQLALVVASFGLAACQPGTNTAASGSSTYNGAPVPVALLVPGGSTDTNDNFIAQSLENAARLAISDLGGVKIDLRVYNTQGLPDQASSMANKAVNDGAKVILGPFFAQEANAAGAAVASRGIDVLSFSNNPDVAGRNVFILGQTFGSTARRLASYAVSKGLTRIMIVHDPDAAGQIGMAAIQSAVIATGGTVAGIETYEYSQNGVVQAVHGIAASAKASNAQALFLTADNSGALPLLSQLLMENGLTAPGTQFIGLSRWDIPAATLALPGVQGAWFALPDPATNQQFQTRYQAAYAAPAPIYAGFAYDGIAAIGAIVKQGGTGSLNAESLTQAAGFVGVGGIFRLRSDGTADRGLAVAQIQNSQVVIVDPAPTSFDGAGF